MFLPLLSLFNSHLLLSALLLPMRNVNTSFAQHVQKSLTFFSSQRSHLAHEKVGFSLQEVQNAFCDGVLTNLLINPNILIVGLYDN